MKNDKKNATSYKPVLRLRSMFIGLCILATGIAIPLVLVWKQSYINQASMRLEYRADTLASLTREVTALSLESGRLSAATRIERIARSRGFDYPTSGQMEIVDVHPYAPKKNNFFEQLAKRLFRGG